jgi:hypothetical protein
VPRRRFQERLRNEVVVNSAICRAISRKAVLEFRYDGKQRVVEPHLHGTSTAGNEVLSAFQIAGSSASRSLGWRLFDVSLITAVRENGDTFSRARPGFNPRDERMERIHCHI